MDIRTVIDQHPITQRLGDDYRFIALRISYGIGGIKDRASICRDLSYRLESSSIRDIRVIDLTVHDMSTSSDIFVRRFYDYDSQDSHSISGSYVVIWFPKVLDSLFLDLKLGAMF